MPLSEKFIKGIVEKARPYIDALEEADRLGKLPRVSRKVRKDFTIDESLFIEFRQKCEKEKIPMSRIIEEAIRMHLSG